MSQRPSREIVIALWQREALVAAWGEDHAAGTKHDQPERLERWAGIGRGGHLSQQLQAPGTTFHLSVDAQALGQLLDALIAEIDVFIAGEQAIEARGPGGTMNADEWEDVRAQTRTLIDTELDKRSRLTEIKEML